MLFWWDAAPLPFGDQTNHKNMWKVIQNFLKQQAEILQEGCNYPHPSCSPNPNVEMRKKESPFSLIFLFWIPQQLMERNPMYQVKLYYSLLFVSKVLSDITLLWWVTQSNWSLWSYMTLLFSTMVSLFHLGILDSGIPAALLYTFCCPVYGGPIRKKKGAQGMSRSTV